MTVQNGASPAPQAAPDYAALHAAAQQEIAALKAQTTKHAEREAAWKKDGERLKALEALEQDRTRNPAKHLEKLFGADWPAAVSKLKDGTASPATVEAAVAQAEERFLGRLTELEGRLREQLGQVTRLEEERAREDLYQGARQHVEASKDKYPLLHALGKGADVGPVIEAHYKATAKQLPDGTWQPGEMWTAEQAAAHLEGHYKELAEKLRGVSLGTASADAPKPRLSVLPDPSVARPDDDDSEAARMARARAAWDKVQAQGRNQR